MLNSIKHGIQSHRRLEGGGLCDTCFALAPLALTFLMAKVQAVIFDLDDTLWDCEEVISRATNDFHRYLSENFPRVAAQFSQAEFYEMMKKVQIDEPHHAHDYTYLRKKALRNYAESAGEDPAAVVDPAFEVFLAARSTPICFPGVIDALRNLKSRGIVLGSLTNGNVDLSKIPELQAVLSFSTSAIEAGASKPHRGPFLKAIELSGFSPTNILHVGDNFRCDILGAKAVGLRTVWVNRKGKDPMTAADYNMSGEAGQQPQVDAADAVVACVSELPALFSEMPESTRSTDDNKRMFIY